MTLLKKATRWLEKPFRRPLVADVLEKFERRRQHAFNKIKWCVPDDLKGTSFLDIGCGIGNGVVAALQHKFVEPVGIDRDLHEFPWFDPDRFDEICQRYGFRSNQAKLISGDLFTTKLPRCEFDVVFMLDSIEHVPDPARFIDKAASLVAPGGVLLIDTCPLYYSQQGAHLFNHFSADEYPWVHLRSDFMQLVQKAEIDSWTLQRFEELNKVTHDEIRNRVEENGLSIIHEDRGKETPELRALLNRDAHVLNISSIEEKLLFEDWICVVGRRPK